jgi:protein-arginine kinase activator protein McsA
MNTYNTQALISKFNEIHGDLYDYSEVIHTHINEEVTIICREHGEFKQIPRSHLQGKGCQECGKISGAEKNRLTNKEIISIFRNVHGIRYDYSEIDFIRSQDKVKIICKEHGPFWQTPNSHRQRKGCSRCTLSKGEALIASILDNEEINYLVEYPVLNPKTGHNLRFDFYLPEKNIFIEFDGLQHFEPVNFGGMSVESSLKVHTRIKARDKIKDKLAKEMDVKLLRIKYDQDIQESLNDNLIIK